MDGIQLNEEEILSILKPLKKKCNTYNRIAMICSTIMILGIMAYMIIGINFFRNSPNIFLSFPFAMITFFVLIFLLFMLKKPMDKAEKAYIDAYKRLIAKPVLDSSFENARYNPLEGYPREDFKNSGLLYLGDSYDYKSEDLITGTYKGVAFRRADVYIKHVTGSGKHRHTVIDANGRLLEVSFHKQINGMVKIVKKGNANTLLDDDRMVEMEDIDFNEKFIVFTNDKHSAFYLLTPQFMEYIKKLYDRDYKVYITFDGRKLCFLQSGHGGIFEPPKEELNIRDEVRKSKAELAEIGEIIEILQLDEAAEREAVLREAGVFLQDEAAERETFLRGEAEKHMIRSYGIGSKGDTKKTVGCMIAVIFTWFFTVVIFLIVFFTFIY